MDDFSTPASDLDVQDTEALIPAFDVDIATVSVVDGMWQDQPDNVATFVEARLGDLARGRGNLYICLDVSGEVEGRSDVERALIEVIRDTFAAGRGSISFSLSEALRAANVYLFDSNRQLAREARRMAGVSAVVLRGNDLYIGQAGPAVVYVEASEKLARYPHESDWFVEDAPLIAPQGAASAPLGIRREFACDLAHTSVSAGDVFVLATRALTQLASTQELAVAFTERSAQDIASHLEELGEDADMTALIAELMDPRVPVVVDDLSETPAAEIFGAEPHIESLPVPLDSLVSLDESEPPLPETDDDQEWDTETAPQAVPASEMELNWDDVPDDEESPHDAQAPELETQDEPEIPQPVYASSAMAMPLPAPSPFTPARDTAPPAREPTRQEWEAELERRRAERLARRAAQQESVSRAVGGVANTLTVAAAGVSGALARTIGAVDWDAFGKQTNRLLNLGVGMLISFFLLLVRLILPGATPRSTALIPRRATSDPIWLKAMALTLPVVFVVLAGGAYLNRQSALTAQYEELIAQADTLVKQAEVNPDLTARRAQLKNALTIVQDAQTIRDSTKARGVLYRIQDQMNELDGVTVLYFLPTLAQPGGAQLKQIAASNDQIFLLDGRGHIYNYTVNDASGAAEPTDNNGVLLNVGDKLEKVEVDALQWMTTVAPTPDKVNLVALTKNAILLYDVEGKQWNVTQVEDANKWGDLRALANFGGNIYLLDARNNQIYRYAPNASGYATKGENYFPANAQPVLNKAVDLAIDGDVWVLNDNGTVQRFRAGTPVPFQLGALATPLKNPVAIYTRAEVDSLYVADAGNQRIVEFDKNGKFVRQFKPYAEKGDVFKNLQDFTVNETKRKIYFINSDAAYMANILK